MHPDRWRPWQQGFTRDGDAFACGDASGPDASRGATQTVILNQNAPRPLVAEAWSRAEGVEGAPDNDYSLYIDLVHADGTPLWGQTAPFATGTHDWQRRQVTIVPEKPVRSLSFHLLLRRHRGRAWFRAPTLRTLDPGPGESFCVFDGMPVRLARAGSEGFQVRDVSARTGFVSIDRAALGLSLETRRTASGAAILIDTTVRDTTGQDRALTLVYSIPWPAPGAVWLAGPRRSETVEPGREYSSTNRFPSAGNERLSRYPFGAVSGPGTAAGLALGLDPATPAFARSAYNATTAELFLALDIALAREKPAATVRIVRFPFDPAWGFRSALTRYHELFPDAFRCRTPRQGLWMPFDRISRVQGWEDFGFAFKEGDNETAWDDRHGILTFRYTEPMTHWMAMPQGMPRTAEAALGELRRLAAAGDRKAKATLVSGFHDAEGRFVARLRDTPWCDGAVWSVNSMPDIEGDPTDFKLKWNARIRESLYGPARPADLDGEYIDSSEGYVTDTLDFRRAHLAAAERPPVFSGDPPRPALFRGLIAFEYARALAGDIHAAGRLMMANGTPIRLWWLAPLLEVLGSETNWHRDGRWTPLPHDDLLYRRALAGPKPYCFLMNTDFNRFPPELVERYMRRCLAYGMFPGFFSADASTARYFDRPELYGRDRALFRRYIPLCRRLAEAGWQPVTLARSDNPVLLVERFGPRLLTILNDSDAPASGTITLEGLAASRCRLLFSGAERALTRQAFPVSLGPEEVEIADLIGPPTCR